MIGNCKQIAILVLFVLAICHWATTSHYVAPRIVVLGDSQAAGMPSLGADSINLAAGGLPVKCAAFRLDRHKPQWIVMHAGIIDMVMGEDAMGNWRTALDAFPCSTRVIVLLPVPFNDACHATQPWLPKEIDNHRMSELRMQLRDLCRQRGVIVLEPPREWFLPDGQMNQRYTRDGLHLNEAAYAPWLKQIRAITSGK